MSKVGIVTDSTNCLPPELNKEYDIRVAPVRLIIDGKDYRDQVDITPAEFWRIFKGLKELPTTSAAGPGDWASAITEMAKSTNNIVCIPLSKKLSATHEGAVQARDIMKSDHPNLSIEVIDSETATGAHGFVVLEAARAAHAGKSLVEVVKVIQDMLPRVKWLMSPDTLKYLIKIGRAPKTAIIGNILQVKPILGMVNRTGLVESLGRVRGKRKAMTKMVDMIKEYIDITKPVHIIAHYSERIEDAEELKEIVTSRYNCSEVYVSEFTPVMAAALGPVVGLAFYS